MRLLAVETSGTYGSIALMEGQRVLDEVCLAEGLRHARDLVVAIRDACNRAAWDRRRIDVVAVSIGPGSFTGIRIAVTFAKFVAWDTGAKVVAVPTLRALAENAPGACGRIVPILDAKRGGLFASIFERRSGPPPSGSAGILSDLDETFGPALIEPEDLARRLESQCAPAGLAPPCGGAGAEPRDRARPAAAHPGGAVFILGPGIPKGRAALAGFELAPEPMWNVRPAVVAHLGWQLHEEGRYADPLRLEPVYIRPPEAQEIWERKHGK